MHPTSWRGHYCRSEVEIGQHVVLAVIDERGQPQPRANVNRRTRDVEFARDSSVEGGVTSELVSGIRGSGPHFGILFPPLTRPRARAATKIPPLWADLPPRRTRVRNEMLEPSGGFNVKAGVAGVWPAQTRQAPWLSSHPVRQPLCGAAAPQGLAEDQ